MRPKGIRDFGVLSFSSPTAPKPGKPEKDGPFFSLESVEALQWNRYLKLEKKSSVAGSNRFTATFFFPPGEQVADLIEDAFWSLNETIRIRIPPGRLKSNYYRDDVIILASDFYSKLVSIHPFWDGNGRTSKIMRDWVLLHFGLPPPAYTPSNDLELGRIALREALLSAMEETRKEFKDGRLNLSP